MTLLTETDLRIQFTQPVLINVFPEAFNDPVALDVEHDESGEWVGVGIYDGTSAYYYSNRTDAQKLNELLKDKRIVAHNGRSDFECLAMWDIRLDASQLYWDTGLMGHISDSSLKSYGLKAMAKRELAVEYPSYHDITGKERAKSRRLLNEWPVDFVAGYNAMDTSVTYKLYEKQKASISASQYDYFRTLERPVGYIFQAMENRGIKIDLKYLEDLKGSLEAQIRPLEASITNDLGPINLNSPKQLLEALQAKEIFPTYRNKPSTDKRALERHRDNPTVSTLLQYSELSTLLSSFVDPYLQRGTEIVRPFFNQCGTRTGRLSCSNPNLLQIPRRTDNGKLVRRMFIAREGMAFGDCDFGQIEPRVLAHLSKDQAMCQMFNEGVDFHTYTAERLGISRDKAKVLNLSVGYRATHVSVSQQLKCTEKEAQNEINNWWALFPGLRLWQDRLLYESKRSGYVTTLLGRRIKVDSLESGNFWLRQAAERQAINNITQGSAAEIMKRAMLLISDWRSQLTPDFGLLIQVYDELLAESSNMAQDIKVMTFAMESCIKLDVPLTVDSAIGSNWSNCH